MDEMLLGLGTWTTIWGILKSTNYMYPVSKFSSYLKFYVSTAVAIIGYVYHSKCDLRIKIHLRLLVSLLVSHLLVGHTKLIHSLLSLPACVFRHWAIFSWYNAPYIIIISLPSLGLNRFVQPKSQCEGQM